MCYAVDGQVIGVGAGQQSRIHCTRLAGTKADLWWLRQHPTTLGLQFKPETKRPDKDNAIDQFLREDVTPAERAGWPELFTEIPRQLTPAEKRQWLAGLKDVVLGSDAFFPFRDSIDRAVQSGVKYVLQPGGSNRDDVGDRSLQRLRYDDGFLGYKVISQWSKVLKVSRYRDTSRHFRHFTTHRVM